MAQSFTNAVVLEWLFWRDTVPVLLNVLSMITAILAAGRVLNAAKSTSAPHQVKLNRSAAVLGAIAVSSQAIAYFVEKAITMKIL